MTTRTIWAIDAGHSEVRFKVKHLAIANVSGSFKKFPTITFKGTVLKEDDEYTLTGELTILGTTRPISLQVEHTGIGKGRFDDLRAGFEVSGKINRKDFGLNFHLLNDAGNLVVGDDIKIQCDIELIKQKAA